METIDANEEVVSEGAHESPSEPVPEKKSRAKMLGNFLARRPGKRELEEKNILVEDEKGTVSRWSFMLVSFS